MERCGIECVLKDYFSKWIEVYAMPDKKALSVAKCLVQFMARYGREEKLHSDLGMEFQANVSKHLYELWGVHKTYTTPYTPWSDGQVERANKTIQQLLKVYCEERLHVWDEYIWCVMQAYRAGQHWIHSLHAYAL